MAELKTKKTDASVKKFMEHISGESRRKDCEALLKLFSDVTGAIPKMWGTSIVGFGDYHYKYATGREGDWFITGFSPRKDNLTVYFCGGLQEMKEELKALGKCKQGVGCLYFKQLADIDQNVLKEMAKKNMQILKRLKKGRG